MNITQQGVPMVYNGDNVIMFTGAKKIKEIQGYADLPSLYSWYQENPEKNHLGMMNLWGQQAQVTYPIYRELLQNRAMIEVNGFDGGFTYDIPVEEYKGCYTTRDMSAQPYPGIDESTFKIVLSHEFTTGDVLTYDFYRGQQIIVVEEPVVQAGDGFEHTVKLVGNDKETWFLASNLAKGLTYVKINHAVAGEYGTNFSHVEMPDSVGSMKCEFKLGSIRGVEAYVTGMADKKSFSGAVLGQNSKQFLQKLQAEAEALGELAILMDTTVNGKGEKVPNWGTMRIGSTMEWLVHRELEKLTAHALLFQKAGTVRDGNGTYRLNEGLWHQLRRGKLIKYGRPGGITRTHLKEAVEYIFRNNPYKKVEERRIKFKGGKYAVANVKEIFKDEFENQLGLLTSIGLLRDTSPMNSPIYNAASSNKNQVNLGIKAVAVTEVYIPDIGFLEIEEDPSLNYHPNVDRFARGMHGEQMADTAYSLVIWDVADKQYSNNTELPKGAKFVDDADQSSNIFLVKPEGDMTYWGRSNGRYDINKAGDIVSSHKQIGQEFWAWNSIAIWVKDLTRFIMIELDDEARKGFN